MAIRLIRRRWLAVLASLVFMCQAALAQDKTSQGPSFFDIQKEIQKANLAFEENRSADALQHLKNAIESIGKYKGSEEDFLREADIWIRTKDPTLAEKALDAALKINPQCGEAYFMRGLIKSKQNTISALNAAAQQFRKALDLPPKDYDPLKASWYLSATNEYAKALGPSKLKQMETAAREFQILSEKHADNPHFCFFLGEARWTLGSYGLAAEAFLKGIALRPNDAQMHVYAVDSLKKSASVEKAIESYEGLLQKHAVSGMRIYLAGLYLEINQKDKALPLLMQSRFDETLDFQLRVELAKSLAKAESHDEAANQLSRILSSTGNIQVGTEINLMIDLGKSLVRSGKAEQGILWLLKALDKHRFNIDLFGEQPLDILFELGSAYLLTNRPLQAELYFREYLHELEEGTVRHRRELTHVLTVEKLGDMYLAEKSEHAQMKDYGKAALVYRKALDIIKVLSEKERVSAPKAQVQFKLAKALHGQKDWEGCIPEAKDLVNHKEFGTKARLILAQAFVGNAQYDKALEQVGHLQGTPTWGVETLKLMGQALLATNRPKEAIKHIEAAFLTRKDDEPLRLLYAQVLGLVDRFPEAHALYGELLKDRPSSVKAWLGIGDLEMHLAKALTGMEREAHLTKAVAHYEQALSLSRDDPDVHAKLGQARGELARAQAEAQAQAERTRVFLYGSGLILAMVIPAGLVWMAYRRHWAAQCFQEVCNLERDLMQLIRQRVQSRWHGRWENLLEEPFRGRVDYKSLRSRAERDGAKDVLAVANFGHLVGIIDAGWTVLGFNELSAPEMADPKEVILANLSYIGSCRTCLAHMGRLEELTARTLHNARPGAEMKSHLPKHLHKQVKTSLEIVRSKFLMKPSAQPELPVLAPVRPPTGKTA